MEGVKDIVIIAMLTAIMAVSAWITIPYSVPFTMQTFAVFLAVRTAGGKKGTAAVLLYILLGAVGVPVFSSFRSGLGTLMGPTGRYIVGFIFIAALYWLFEKKLKNRVAVYAVLLVGLAICYAFGTLQFVMVSKTNGNAIGFVEALTLCVFPYIIPDVLKLVLAELIGSRVRKALKEPTF